jgi:hypothetical protein
LFAAEVHHLLVETKCAQLDTIVLQVHKKKDHALQVCTAQKLHCQHQKDPVLQDITAMQVQQLQNLLMEFKVIFAHQDSIVLLEVHLQ